MSFAALPTELQQQIIAEVLDGPPSSLSSTRANHHLCNAPNAAALAVMSKSWNAFVTPLLYSNVRATTPSSLRQLKATLTRRPDLAAIITKLHIGADKELPEKGWPMSRSDDPSFYPIQTTLAEEQLPRWCRPGMSFNVKDPQLGGEVTGIERAIQAAMKDLDVNPFKRGYSLSSEWRGIGMQTWSARLFLLQAAVDIYLMKMGEVDPARKGSPRMDGTLEPWAQASSPSSPCQHYPSLKIIFDASSFRQAREGVFLITRKELWEHLLKPGGSADHFDHLIRLSRSKPYTLDLQPGDRREHAWQRIERDLGGPYTPGRIGISAAAAQQARETLHYENSWMDSSRSSFPAWCSGQSNVESDSSRSGETARDALDGQRVEDLIKAGRSLLALVPRVTSLSLTSYFHRALPSLRSPALLRSLVIGPKDRYWDEVLPDLKPFEQVVRIRVVGNIHYTDGMTLQRWLMRQVQKFEWEFPERYVDESSISATLQEIQSLLCLLLLDPVDPPSALSRGATALLHPAVAPSILRRGDIQPEMRRAWREGKAMPHYPYFVKVTASDAVVPVCPGERPRQDTAALYAKSLRWWLEG